MAGLLSRPTARRPGGGRRHGRQPLALGRRPGPVHPGLLADPEDRSAGQDRGRRITGPPPSLARFGRMRGGIHGAGQRPAPALGGLWRVAVGLASPLPGPAPDHLRRHGHEGRRTEGGAGHRSGPAALRPDPARAGPLVGRGRRRLPAPLHRRHVGALRPGRGTSIAAHSPARRGARGPPATGSRHRPSRD